MVKLKRLTVGWAKRKKEYKFITQPKGAHRMDSSVPLVVVLRDEMKVASAAREARCAIGSGKVLVDGRACRDRKRGIGLFDTVEIPDAKLHARMVVRKGLEMVGIPQEEARLKVCKINGKKAVRGGRIQLNLHDGRNIVLPKDSYSTNDSLLISLPDQKVVDHLKFEEGALVLVTSGSQSGRVARIKKVEAGINRRLWIDEDGRTYEAPFKGVIVIGREKPSIKIGE